jgi:type I restriction enzyme R subunit
MTPDQKAEERARVLIDEQLVQAGWVVQDRKDIDLVSHIGVAVREVFMQKWAKCRSD